MQLVIELTDEQWKCVQDGTWCGSKEILNGTPLPKGHGKLIDADKIILEATEKMKYPTSHKYMECVIAHMKLADTIIKADGGAE